MDVDQSKETSSPSKILRYTKPIFTLVKKNPLLFVILMILSVIGIFHSQYLELTKDPTHYQPRQYIDNVLFITDSRLNHDTSPSSLTVRFNYPVDPHDISHFALLTPKIKGKWIADKSDKRELHYTFDKKYRGSYISLYINQGLTNQNNKTLLNNYEKYFSLANNQQREPYARVKTYPAGKPVPLSSDAESISVYKSNAYNLLSFLTYSLPDNEIRGSIYNGNYIQKNIPHTEADKLKSLKINSDENTLTLDSGVYYIEGDKTEPYFIVISSFGVVLRQDDKRVIVGSFNIKDETKIKDQVTFGFYNLHNNVQLLRDFTSSEENMAQPLSYPTRLDVVIGIYKDEVAFIPVELPSSYADIQVSSNLDTDTKMFLYTDRPIYKPGDKVFCQTRFR